MVTRQLRQQVNNLFTNHEYNRVKELLLSYKEITEHSNDLAMVCYLCTVFEREKEAGQSTLFSKVSGTDELLERYTALKFYLRRLDFDLVDDMDIFYRFLLENQVSSFELLGAIDFSVVHKEKVLQAISGNLELDRESSGTGRFVTGSRSDELDRLVKDSESVTDEFVLADAEQEICFIICSNNPVYAQECIYYIEHLNIPDGFQVDVLTVEEAKSLTSAYNEAMQCSQAKYKVYLHHDTFIINPDLINECLNIFRKDPLIGMIGNIGVKKMPATGVMWDADRYGMLYEQHIYETQLLANAVDSEMEYLEVDAIDGFIMVTQYDIPWREDLFDKWDFYDCSQSMEFKRRGYKVVVPRMKQPWCVHDCGFINLQDYDTEREKFIKEYDDLGTAP